MSLHALPWFPWFPWCSRRSKVPPTSCSIRSARADETIETIETIETRTDVDGQLEDTRRSRARWPHGRDEEQCDEERRARPFDVAVDGQLDEAFIPFTSFAPLESFRGKVATLMPGSSLALFYDPTDQGVCGFVATLAPRWSCST